MYGDIIEIAENTLLAEGLEPALILKEPDIASSVLHKSHNTLYIMDAGATIFFRNRIRESAERLRPFENLILFNSHGYPDHTPNNAVIHEIPAIDSYFRFEFPKMPPILKTNITYALLEEDVLPKGLLGKSVLR